MTSSYTELTVLESDSSLSSRDQFEREMNSTWQPSGRTRGVDKKADTDRDLRLIWAEGITSAVLLLHRNQLSEKTLDRQFDHILMIESERRTVSFCLLYFFSVLLSWMQWSFSREWNLSRFVNTSHFLDPDLTLRYNSYRKLYWNWRWCGTG